MGFISSTNTNQIYMNQRKKSENYGCTSSTESLTDQTINPARNIY